MAAAAFFLVSCSNHKHTITVTNGSDLDRINETVYANIEKLCVDANQIILKEALTGLEIQSQLIDNDADGTFEAICFQATVKSNESKQYFIQAGESTLQSSEVKTFARFVPERTDDFAWENDRVAFRTYGPKAQQIAEAGQPGGTLSSGIDCWLKKVDYAIIDKWYKGNTEKPGYYHIDHGEGLDNYHVGPSRGCGGTGVMKDDKLISSKNFVDYKVFANGPVSSQFELDYAPYQVGEKTVKERKLISIDLGHNFTKYVIEVEGTDTLTTGITLHDLKGEISENTEATWLNYHTPHKGEYLSSSVVVHPKYFAGRSNIKSDVKDESHALLHLKVIDGKVEFYSGFYWSGSKQYANNAEWEKHLSQFAEQIKQPLAATIK